MEISHFLSIIDSLCIVNVLYSESSDVTLLQQNKLIPVTAHKRTELDLLEFVFHRVPYLQFGLYSDNHCKHICTVFIVLMDVKPGELPAKTSRNSSENENEFSVMRTYTPRRNYFAVLFDIKSFLSIGSKASLLCVKFCSYRENLMFLIKEDFHSPVISTMCVLSKHFSLGKEFRVGKEGLDLQTQMKCMPIQNTVNSLDNLFLERVDVWTLRALLHPNDNHLLSNPAKALQQFSLKVLLQRLRIRNGTVFTGLNFPWDADLVSWYIILHLLSLSNSSGTKQSLKRETFTVFKEEFMTAYDGSLNYFHYRVTGSTEYEAITCYTQPLLSFHIYSSPFLFNLWISISLVVVFLSVFLNICIYFFHRKCSSSILSTLFSVSLLANASYYVPKSVWDSNVFICTCTPWILTTMILSNCYQSLVISEVNAPMKGEQLKNVPKYTISDNKTSLEPSPEYIKATKMIVRKLELNTKYDINSKSSLTNYLRCIHEERVKYQRPNCFALLSETLAVYKGMQNGLISSLYLYISLILAKENEVVDFSEESVPLYNYKYHALDLLLRLYPLDPNFRPSDGVVLEREAAIEKELIKCEKSVYLASKEAIHTEISYLQTNYDRLRFYRIKQFLVNQTLTGWMCSYHKNSQFPKLLNGFIESGIIAKLNYLEQYTTTLLRRKGTAVLRHRKLPVQPIKLSDSIHTVFILYGALISLSVFGLLLEFYAQIIRRKFIANIQVSMIRREYKRFLRKLTGGVSLYMDRFIYECGPTKIKNLL